MAKKKATPPAAAAAAGLASAAAPAGQKPGSGEGTEQGTTEQGTTEQADASTEQGRGDAERGQGDAAEPQQQYPIEDVLRNNGSGEFACRETGLFLSPGASRAVTIRDAEHLAVLAQAIEAFDRTQPRAGLLKFDGVALEPPIHGITEGPR